MRKLLKTISDWRRDESGVVAMEFAFIAPVLIFMFFGAISIYDTMRAARQASQTTLILSDLATRTLDMSDDKRDALFITANSLMSSWDANGTYSISVTSVINPKEEAGDEDVDAEVSWSEATSETAKIKDADLAKFDLPTIIEGDSLVLVEIKGDYSPIFAMLGIETSYSIERSSVRRPRFVSELIYAN